MKSSFQGLHVAVIMDGNGRWAERRGLPRPAGHRAGAKAVRPLVEAASELGVGTLTLYAFSADNWRRPPREVAALMGLLRRFVVAEAAELARAGVRLSFIGRRDRLAPAMVEAIAHAEAITAQGQRLHLRIAVDYSAREAILRAAGRLDEAPRRDLPAFQDLITRAHGGHGVASPDVDLLIRTGGEQRLSDFLLWECAYAELLFLDAAWPDFGPGDFAAALAEYGTRQRRFGGLTAASPGS